MNYFCTYCQDEISSFQCQSNSAYNSMIIFVRCAICEDFFLCLMVTINLEILKLKLFKNDKM